MAIGKRKHKLLICVTLFLLLTCTIVQLLSVISPNWYKLQCQNGTLLTGLWQYCGSRIVTTDRNSTHGPGKPAVIDLFGYKQETETCASVSSHVSGGAGNQAWFYVNRILQCLAVAASSLCTVLFLMYSISKQPLPADLIRGLFILAFTAAAFISVGLFCIAGNNPNVWKVLPEEYNDCSNGKTTTEACIYLIISCAVFACISGICLGIIWMIEKPKKGDLIFLKKQASDHATMDKTEDLNKIETTKPKRLRATCTYTPNIKSIAAERRLSFCGMSGALAVHTPGGDSGLDATNVSQMDNNNTSLMKEGSIIEPEIDDSAICLHF